ncbi:hypothetical protein Tco_0566286 [Tanacetum coccineum]
MKIDFDDKTDDSSHIHKKLFSSRYKKKKKIKKAKYDGILRYENEMLQSVFMNKESDIENQPVYDSLHMVQTDCKPSNLDPIKGEIDTCESNISTESSELVTEPFVNESNVESQPKVWTDAPIIEEYESDSEYE